MTDATAALSGAFPGEAIPRGRAVLFRLTDAPRVLDFLRSRGWQVLGIEGFHADGSGVRPDLDRIADLSTAADGVRSARHLLDAWADDPALLVQFTVRAGSR